MKGQGHIFTFDLIFLCQRAILRGPAFGEWHFLFSLVSMLYVHITEYKFC